MWEFLRTVAARATVADWVLLGTAALLLLWVAGSWNYDYFARRGVAYARPWLPFIGNVFSGFVGLVSFPDLMQDVYDNGKGHAIFGLFQFQTPFYVIRDPELLKHITVKDFDHFTDHREVVKGDPDPIFNRNLFSLKGDRWRAMRATLSPAFTTSKVKGLLPLVAQTAEQLVVHLRQEHAKGARGNKKKPLETDMKDVFTRLANDVIGTVAFGVGCDSLKEPENEFYLQGKSLTTFRLPRMIIFILYLVIPKIMAALKMRVFDPKAISFLDSLVHNTIQERQKKSIFRPDMLQLLIQARDGQLKIAEEDKHEAEKTGAIKHELTNDDISGQAVIFFFAGFETVSTVLSFTSYALSHNPDIQTRLQQEIDEMMRDTGGKPTYESVQGMKYLDGVINESLRLYPPVINLDRVCVEDVTLPATDTSPAVSMHKGDGIIVSIMGLHRDPDYWPHPYKFDPNRFNDENKRSVKPYTYMPFGLGPRLCIGQRMAVVEVKLALIHLLANFDLRPSSKTKHPMQYDKGFNTSIRGGFWSNIIPREAT